MILSLMASSASILLALQNIATAKVVKT